MAGATWSMHLVGLVTVIVAARVLGPTQFGAATVAAATVTMGATLLDVALEEAVVFEGFRLMAADKLGEVKSLLLTALILDVGIGLAVAGILAATAWIASDLFLPDGTDVSLVYIAIAGTLASTIDGTASAVLLLLQAPERRATIGFVAAIVRLVLVVGAMMVIPTATGLVAANAVASLAGALLLASISWRAGRRFRKAEGPATFKRALAKTVLSLGTYSSITSSLGAVGVTAVPVVLAHWAGVETAALYRIAFLPITVAAMASMPVRTLLLPHQAYLFSVDRTTELARSIRRYMEGAAAFAIVGSVVGYFLLPTLIEGLYGPSYLGAVTAARILLIGASLHLMTAWTKSFSGAVGQPKTRAVILLFEVSVTFMVLIALGGDSLTYAAMSVVAGMFVSTAIWAILTPKLVRVRQQDAQ